MNSITIEIEDKVDELLVALDVDIEYIRKTLINLDELRSMVVKRNDVSLGRLLENVRSETDGYNSHESKRQSIRKELAAALGYGPDELTLSKLENELSGERAHLITKKKVLLLTLTEKLRNEYLATNMLLADCARLNGVLLRGIFNLCNKGTGTYNSSGTATRETDTAFVNLQF